MASEAPKSWSDPPRTPPDKFLTTVHCQWPELRPSLQYVPFLLKLSSETAPQPWHEDPCTRAMHPPVTAIQHAGRTEEWGACGEADHRCPDGTLGHMGICCQCHRQCQLQRFRDAGWGTRTESQQCHPAGPTPVNERPHSLGLAHPHLTQEAPPTMK